MLKQYLGDFIPDGYLTGHIESDIKWLESIGETVTNDEEGYNLHYYDLASGLRISENGYVNTLPL